MVVLDACDDASFRLAGRFEPDVHFLQTEARNVGAARAAVSATPGRLSATLGSTIGMRPPTLTLK